MEELDDGTESGGGENAGRTAAPGAITACYACGAPIAGPFCAACGQKNDDMRRSILVLLGETLAAVVALDSRAFRTIRTIAARPGRFVREYGDGVRSRYTPPIRLYVLISLFFFTIVALSGTNFVAFELEYRGPDGEVLTELPDDPDADISMSFHPRFLQPKTAGSDVSRIRAAIKEALERETTPEEEAALKDAAGEIAEEFGPAPSVTIDLDEEEDKETIKRWSDAALTALERPAVFNAAFNEWLPRLMFVMAPLLALFLSIGVRGKDALIYDHLLLSLIIHAVAFFGLAVAVFAARQFPGGPVALGLGGFVTLYLIMALKGAYGRSWIKTIWTAVFSTTLYWLVMAIALTGVGFLSLSRLATTG
ncbi:MAG: DUF3667 domain-containing protein [Pseudomonadota bacterium]